MKKEVLFLAVVCAVALGLDEDYRRRHKPAATLSPPGEFTPRSSKPPPANITTAHTTKPTPANITTAHTSKPTPANITTAHTTKPTPANITTAHTTKPAPANITTAHTTKPTPANITTAHTTKPTPANITTISPTSSNKTTTHPVVPPTPKPTPHTNLIVGTYILKKNNILCVKAVMAIQIKLETSSTPKEQGAFIIQPNETSVAGGCSDTEANFTLAFTQGNITLLFRKNTTSNSVYVHSVSFNVDYIIVPSGPPHNSRKNDSLQSFDTTVGSYYSCRNESLFMGQGYKLEMTAVKLQAFNFTNGDFGLPQACPSDKTDYSVAIAVGVVLLILIIIVVVAYLIGRRKRTDGYQSL